MLETAQQAGCMRRQARAEQASDAGAAAQAGRAVLAAGGGRVQDRPQAARHPGGARLQLRGALPASCLDIPITLPWCACKRTLAFAPSRKTCSTCSFAKPTLF